MNLRLLLAAGLCAATLLPAGAAPKDCITVAVLSLNDFHGAFIRDARKGIPGAAAIWQTVDSLKRVYPYHVTVAAGDNFGGSYFSTATQSRLLPVFFNDLGIRISAVGNHEFDNGTAWLAQKWAGSDMLPRGWELTYVCANVADASGRCPSYMQPFATEEIKLPSGRSITVAFVGLITSSTPLQTRRANTAGLSFDGRYDAVTATLSRRPEYAAVDSADVRILLTHIGTKMSGGSPAWHDADSARIAAFADPRFHAILSAHSHEAVCGRINGGRYPIVQGEWHGNYIGLLKLTVDTVSMTVRGAEAELCPVRPDVALGEGPRRLNAQIDSLLRVTKTAGGYPLGRRLTVCRTTLTHDRTKKLQLTEVGGLVCTAYAEAFRSAARLGDDAIVVGTSHFGSIRAGIPAGDVSVLDVGEILPFANRLIPYRITGSQLTTLVNFGLHNTSYGWLQTNGLRIGLDSEGNVSSLTYVTPGGTTKTIHPQDTCYLVADEFITTGGDGYDPAFFPAAAVVGDCTLPVTTDAFIAYLRTLPAVGDGTRHTSVVLP